MTLEELRKATTDLKDDVVIVIVDWEETGEPWFYPTEVKKGWVSTDPEDGRLGFFVTTKKEQRKWGNGDEIWKRAILIR
jgi:hypothetical protein